jgi:uncharacterized membrane protein
MRQFSKMLSAIGLDYKNPKLLLLVLPGLIPIIFYLASGDSSKWWDMHELQSLATFSFLTVTFTVLSSAYFLDRCLKSKSETEAKWARRAFWSSFVAITILFLLSFLLLFLSKDPFVVMLFAMGLPFFWIVSFGLGFGILKFGKK